LLNIFYGFGGLGVGILYGVSTACAIKWFPDKRGFATGFVVFGFGAGTALFNWVIQGLLELKGFQATFIYAGIFMMATLIPLALLYKFPSENASLPINVSLKRKNESDNYRPIEMLKTYQWFIMYFSFIVTVSIVLMFGAQMRMLANEFNIPSHYFSLVLVLFPIGNGLSRIVAGAVSDRIGREKTMVTFYSLLGLSILSFMWMGHIPLFFVILVFITATLGGAPFALYPATIGDYYGESYATTNYGITYTAKAWAGFISGWLSGYLVITFGSFRIPLAFVGVCSLLAALISSPMLLKSPRKSN
jgi:OFA family oxalate/formate antiporter-like MFS transporter